MEKLIALLVRPPRMEYDIEKLFGGLDGEFRLRRSRLISNKFFKSIRRQSQDARNSNSQYATLEDESSKYFRKDFTLLNDRNIAFECSHYVPFSHVQANISRDTENLLPCVIYLHGNAGSRLDANSIVKLLLPMDITVLALDFSGCGRSEGDYISLGHYEQDDVSAAVKYLRSEGRTSLISIWGRSMGAVTALLYTSKDPSIAGVVLDSPFSKLPDLMMELASSLKINVAGYTIPALPSGIASVAISVLRASIRRKYVFDIDDLDAIKVAPDCYCPALFGHGEDDDFIDTRHSRAILENYSGDCDIIEMKATHNSARPSSWYRNAAMFLSKVLHGGLKDTQTLFEFNDEEKDFDTNQEYIGMPKSFNGSEQIRSAVIDDPVVTIASSPSCSSSDNGTDSSDDSDYLEIMYNNVEDTASDDTALDEGLKHSRLEERESRLQYSKSDIPSRTRIAETDKNPSRSRSSTFPQD